MAATRGVLAGSSGPLVDGGPCSALLFVNLFPWSMSAPAHA